VQFLKKPSKNRKLKKKKRKFSTKKKKIFTSSTFKAVFAEVSKKTMPFSLANFSPSSKVTVLLMICLRFPQTSQ